MTQRNQPIDESFLFELVDLLECRAIAKYELEIQADYEQSCDPKPGTTFEID